MPCPINTSPRLSFCAVQRETAATLTKRRHHRALRDDADPDDYELLDYCHGPPVVSRLA